ncbi:phenylalanine--tRNA ligase subunit alpha [Candidatus Omnitrophota bacterium]
MPRDIEHIEKQACEQIEAAGDIAGLEEVRIRYLGRKGIVSQILAELPNLAVEQRPRAGKTANLLKQKLTQRFQERLNQLKEDLVREPSGSVDITLPGIAREAGSLHPVTQVVHAICAIFKNLGFKVIEGPEVETEYNNFTALNIPLEHPSRDAFDTFYIDDVKSNIRNKKLLLRSHTSPVQARVMKHHKPPLAVVVPGKVYRPDAVDASHSFVFHQIEGFLVDANVRLSDLKGVLEHFAKETFGKDIKMRFRPHYFPFTEPSAEVDISCIICKGKKISAEGKKCSVCSGKGWLEILGAGMIHPQVFEAMGYRKNKYTGFAFGMGVERIAMLKYGINDIRLFFENDIRFLKQF